MGQRERERLGEIDISIKIRTTYTWAKRSYEALPFPRIGYGPFLCNLGWKAKKASFRRAQAIIKIQLWKS